MRDAARAGASCCTLLRVWRRQPDLIFDEDTLFRRGGTGTDLVRLVDATLLRHRTDTALQTLTVRSSCLHGDAAASVRGWLRFALGSTVTRRLTLDLSLAAAASSRNSCCLYDFPPLGAAAATALEHLHLRSGSLLLKKPPPKLTNLAAVVLDTVRVTSQGLERFLSSCYKLESLELRRCDQIVHVRVPPAPRRLDLQVHRCRSVRSIRLSESHVTSLVFTGQNRRRRLLVVGQQGAQDTRRATFNLQYGRPSFPDEPPEAAAAAALDRRLDPTSLAHAMPRLETLSLSLSILIRLKLSPNQRFLHLKHLNLSRSMDGNKRSDFRRFRFVVYFLRAAPALESLKLHLLRTAPALDASPGSLHLPTEQPRSPHQGLKAVHITGFSADLALLQLALYILENARALERLSLDPTQQDERDWPDMIHSYPGWFRKMTLAQEAIDMHIGPVVESMSAAGSRTIQLLGLFHLCGSD
ncbi:uncharacterized protein LOC112272427 isoform X2 [Brachypodium distachyon]|nr:uncharacterized protein LOC112272427 isoform X2 [Brachypodium distachyon]PNT65587.1 hypothetical protein BRADI_4g44736v3 [Brachypodium distachyon]|eukprot:XP_024318920.1 uncharacterized protein LOC112272427 isoform X2 [Brachypodium distachyon]